VKALLFVHDQGGMNVLRRRRRSGSDDVR
jgi:hypothetical protein